MKKCKKCDESKPLNDYHKNSATKDGHQTICKSCIAISNKKWYYENHERNLEVRRNWDRENKEHRKQYAKKWRKENREKNIIYAREYRKNNKDKVNKYRKWYYENGPNSPKNNLEKRARETKRKRDKRNTDPLYRTQCNIRRRVCEIFAKNNLKKPRKTEHLVGCSWETAMKHLEKQFVDGMSWDNRHLWHVDHIIPLDIAKTEDEIIKLCHYTNLQPLWAADNIAKSNKLLV